MSRFDYGSNLEEQLDNLQLAQDKNTPGKAKKIPPAVPPKKKNFFSPSTNVGVYPETGSSYGSPSSLSLRRPDDTNNLHTPTQHFYNDYANQNFFNSSEYSDKSTANNARPLMTNSHKIFSGTEREYSSKSPLSVPDLTSSQGISSEHYLPPPSPVSSNYSELVRATNNMNFGQEKGGYSPVYQNEVKYGSHPSSHESLYEPIKLASNFQSISSNDTNRLENSKKQLPKEAEVDALTDLLVKSISDSQDLDYFGICVKCNEKVLGENSGCTAMGNMYHIKCFCCFICNTNLHGKRLYAVEGQPYCEEDYYETLEKCTVCRKPILDRILRATGNPYHRTCFTCVVCNKSLDAVPFTVDAMNQIHCIEDFHKKFAPRCCVCDLPIMPEEGEEETVRVVALDRSFHVNCYRCEDCGLQLSSEEQGRGCYPLDDHILCKHCNAFRIQQLTNVITTDL